MASTVRTSSSFSLFGQELFRFESQEQSTESPTSSPPKAGSRSSGHSQQPQQQVGNPFFGFITNSFKELQGNTPTDQLRPIPNSFNNEPVVYDIKRGIIGNSNGSFKGGVAAWGSTGNNKLKQIAVNNDVRIGNIEKPEPKVNVSEDDRKAYWFSQFFSDFIPVPKDDLNTTAPVAHTSRNQTENGFDWGGGHYSTIIDHKGNFTHTKEDSFFTRWLTNLGIIQDESGSDVSPSGERTTASDRYKQISKLSQQQNPRLSNHLNSLGNSTEETTSAKPESAISSSGDRISSQKAKTLWTERASSIHSSGGRTNSNGSGDRTSATSSHSGGRPSVRSSHSGGGRTSVRSSHQWR